MPARASILVGLALAVLAGFGVRRVCSRDGRLRRRGLRSRRSWWRSAIDLRPILRLEPVWPEPPPIYGARGGQQSRARRVPVRRQPRAASRWNMPFMYFSLWHWTDMVNGYSGHYPTGQVDFEVELQGFPDARTIWLLRARGATHVTVNCAFYSGGCDDLLERVEAMPDFRLVASARWQGQPARLYELRR